MRMNMLGSPLKLSAAAFVFATSAWAQDPAAEGYPAEAPAAEPPMPAPAAPMAAEPTAPAEMAPMPTEAAAPVEAPTEEGDDSMPAAWFRIDSDGLGLQLWAGATHPLADGIGLASDIYVVDTIGEFDIGPAFAAGPFTATPMMGIAFDWSARQAVSLIPQFFLVGGPDPIYLELWVQAFMYSVFEEDATNQLYTRFFIDYKISDYFAIGPQVEATLNLNGDGDTVASLPVGGSVMLSNYGAGNALFAFLGYETNEAAREGGGDEDPFSGNALVGRLSFVRNF